MKNIEKLAEKRTYLRKGIEKIMKDFAEKTKDAAGFSAEVFASEENGYDYRYYIRTDCKDIYWDSSQGHTTAESRWNDYNPNGYFYNIMSIRKLRKVCKALPGAFKEIQNQIDEELKEIEGFDGLIEKINVTEDKVKKLTLIKIREQAGAPCKLSFFLDEKPVLAFDMLKSVGIAPRQGNEKTLFESGASTMQLECRNGKWITVELEDSAKDWYPEKMSAAELVYILGARLEAVHNKVRELYPEVGDRATIKAKI